MPFLLPPFTSGPSPVTMTIDTDGFTDSASLFITAIVNGVIPIETVCAVLEAFGFAAAA